MYISGYEGYYSVFENGDIFSHKSNKVLKTSATRGYLGTVLRINGKSKRVIIHRIVALHFIPNPLNKPTVNHKDGNKKNNHVSNLEWATHKENMLHAYQNGLIPQEYKKVPVIQYSKDGKFVNEYESFTQAHLETGINLQTIHQVCCGKRGGKTAGGFIWSLKK